MSKSVNDPAFPSPGITSFYGMSILDYVAIEICSGITPHHSHNSDQIAFNSKWAIEQAKSLLKHLGYQVDEEKE